FEVVGHLLTFQRTAECRYSRVAGEPGRRDEYAGVWIVRSRFHFQRVPFRNQTDRGRGSGIEYNGVVVAVGIRGEVRQVQPPDRQMTLRFEDVRLRDSEIP